MSDHRDTSGQPAAARVTGRRERLADAHRMIGQAEHRVERRMLDQAGDRPSEEAKRQRARAISRNADRHLAQAERLDPDQ